MVSCNDRKASEAVRGGVITRKMEKLIVENQMPANSGFDLAAISALVNSNRGMSPEALMAMCQKQGIGGGDGGSLIVLILFLLLIGGNGGGLFGNNGGGGAPSAAAQGSFDTSILLRAVDGNAADMRALATTFNCDINRITEALSTILGGVDKVAGEVRSTSKDVINAIQAGNCQLGSQLSSCCCAIEKSILSQTNSINVGFSQVGFQQAQDKCEILAAVRQEGSETRAQMTEQFYSLEKRELQREITERDRRITTLEFAASQQQQTANLATIIRNNA